MFMGFLFSDIYLTFYVMSSTSWLMRRWPGLGALVAHIAGPEEMHIILALKSTCGFGSVSAIYYALHCLPMGDAIVLSFTRLIVVLLCCSAYLIY
jgi:hypothetical protein